MVHRARNVWFWLVLSVIFPGDAGAQVIITHPLPYPRMWSFNGKEDGVKPRVHVAVERPETVFRYYSEDGTARAGIDYLAVSGLGSNGQQIEITVLNDGKIEPPKTLKVVAIEESTPPRTNWVEVVIYDDEIPRSIDSSFHSNFTPLTPGFSISAVYRLVAGRVLADDTIVVAEPSGFTVVNADGTVRAQRIFPEQPNYEFWAQAVTPAGNVLSARRTGVFHPSVGLDEWALMQYLANGQKDEAFVPELPPSHINGFTTTADGKILVSVTTTNQPATWMILRLNADGSRDGSFTAIQGPENEPRGAQHIAVRPDGSIEVVSPGPVWRRRVYLGGQMVEDTYWYSFGLGLQPKLPEMSLGDGIVMAGNPPTYISYLEAISYYRIRADGSLDESFVPGLLSTQSAYIGTQRDGKVIMFENGQLMRFNTAAEQTNRVSIVGVDLLEEHAESAVYLRRTGDTTQARTVRLQTRDVTAKAGVDYAALDTLVTFEPFKAVVSVPISMIDDNLSDAEEVIAVSISSPNNDVLIENGEALGTIYDNEPHLRLETYLRPGGMLIRKAFEPPWNAMLQSSTNLGATWTDVGLAVENTWMIPPDLTARSVIFRAVKVD